MGSDHARRLEFAVAFALEGGMPAPSVTLATRLEIVPGVGRRRHHAAGREEHHSQREPHRERRHAEATLGARSAACQAAVCSSPRARRARRWPNEGETSGLEGRVAGSGLALLVALVATTPLLIMVRTAAAVPVIHDVTTDTDNPPPWVALQAARAASENGTAYGGPTVATQQKR